MAAAVVAAPAGAAEVFDPSYAGTIGLTPPPGLVRSPTDAAVDAQGFAYVITGAYVQRYDPSGRLLNRWGGLGTGPGQFLPSLSYRVGPSAIDVDAAGHVYVADRGGNRILVFADDGTFLAAWGRNGGDGSAGHGPGELKRPIEVAVEALGTVLVVDESYALQRFSSAGTPLLWRDRVGDQQVALAADGSVYARSPWTDTVDRLDAGTLTPAGAIQLPPRPPTVNSHMPVPPSCCGLAVVGGSVWAGSSVTGELQRYAPDGTLLSHCNFLTGVPFALPLGGDALVAGRDGLLYVLQRSKDGGRLVRLSVEDHGRPCPRMIIDRFPLPRQHILSLGLTLAGKPVHAIRASDLTRVRLTYALSKTGDTIPRDIIFLEVIRLEPGRRLARTCRQPSRRTRRYPRCTRRRTAASAAGLPSALANSYRLAGGVHPRLRRPGRYELVLTSYDPYRNRGPSARLRMRVTR